MRDRDRTLGIPGARVQLALFLLLFGMMVLFLGSMRTEAAVTCVWCRGKGEVTCSNCGGSGAAYGSVRASCYKCHGSGYETCRYCGGSGKLGASASGSSGVTSDGSFVSLSSGSVTLVAGGKTKLSVSGTKKKVRWKSSKASVASVSSKGVVKAKKAGKAKITATIGKTKLTCTVKVNKKKYATGISLPGAVTLARGKRTTLGYTLKPAGVNQTPKITWKSSNKGVVTVDKSGNVTAVGTGTAKVTATLKKKNGKKKKATCTVTVLTGAQVLRSRLASASQAADGSRVFKSGSISILYYPGTEQFQFYLSERSETLRITCSSGMTGQANLWYTYSGYNSYRFGATVDVSQIGRISSYPWKTNASSSYTMFANFEVDDLRRNLNKVLSASFGLTLADIGLAPV